MLLKHKYSYQFIITRIVIVWIFSILLVSIVLLIQIGTVPLPVIIIQILLAFIITIGIRYVSTIELTNNKLIIDTTHFLIRSVIELDVRDITLELSEYQKGLSPIVLNLVITTKDRTYTFSGYARDDLNRLIEKHKDIVVTES